MQSPTLTAEDVAALAPMSIPECGVFFHEKFGLGESDRISSRKAHDLSLGKCAETGESRGEVVRHVTED